MRANPHRRRPRTHLRVLSTHLYLSFTSHCSRNGSTSNRLDPLLARSLTRRRLRNPRRCRQRTINESRGAPILRSIKSTRNGYQNGRTVKTTVMQPGQSTSQSNLPFSHSKYTRSKNHSHLPSTISHRPHGAYHHPTHPL